MDIRRTEKTENVRRVTGDLRSGKDTQQGRTNKRKPSKRGLTTSDNNNNKTYKEIDKDKSTMAAALKYDPEADYAPQISALGKGVIAENILRIAKESNIPVYRDEQLVSTLSRLHVGDDIPRELFEVVAEVLVFISRSDERYGKYQTF